MNLFGIGGWELGMVAIIALLVLGPERLVRHAFTAGRWLRDMSKVFTQVSEGMRDQLAEEVPMDEITETLNEFRGLQQSAKDLAKPFTVGDAARKARVRNIDEQSGKDARPEKKRAVNAWQTTGDERPTPAPAGAGAAAPEKPAVAAADFGDNRIMPPGMDTPVPAAMAATQAGASIPESAPPPAKPVTSWATFVDEREAEDEAAADGEVAS